MRLRFAAGSLLVMLGAAGIGARATTPPPLNVYFAGMHNHTGYSDGVPGTTPASAYAKARQNGLDIMTTTEHSEGFDVPMTFSEQCLDPNIARCALADRENSVRKWDANEEQAVAATGPGFVAARGFEWTSDVEDHINVYLSSKYTNAKIDGGYATMSTFWKWVLDNKDALVTFNHPGDKTNQNTQGLKIAPGPFDDFRYVPDADRRVVGIEVFNGGKTKDYTGSDGVNWIARALDKGWHVGLVGAQDTHTDDWGDPNLWARTGFLMPSLSRDNFRDALLARHFYATIDSNVQLSFGTSVGDIMGARIRKPVGESVTIEAAATDPDGDPVTRIELMSNGGAVVGSQDAASAQFTVASGYGERWYVARFIRGTKTIAYSSPIWVGASTHPYGEWLSGDLHVHTQNGHDTCMAADPTKRFDGTDCELEEMYTWSFSPGERIALAKERGLDYLAITDHQNITTQSDLEYIAERNAEASQASSLTLIPSYENSLPGHAQMLGASHCFGGSHVDGSTPIPITYCDNPTAAPHGVTDEVTAIQSEMTAIRSENGIFQINHPGDAICTTGCGKWYNHFRDYLLDMVPDSIEVWNIGPWEWQQPAVSANDNDFALRFWEMFLNAGNHVAATGGSDSHWRATSALQGIGQPTTWVYSSGRSWQDVLAGIHDGYTMVSHQPPAYAGQRLYLEADADGNGTFESMPGDTIPDGSLMRIRATNAPPGASVHLVSSTGTREIGFGPDGTSATFTATGSWLRAELLVPDGQGSRQSTCDPVTGTQTMWCRNRLIVLSLTSAIYQVP
ncbi:MAG: CehA/McbA family metallohydrolase [Actinomycetota bacterium]|nr:CehA/McbA family metallohydrolase [Actinomycetota bacterium]